MLPERISDDSDQVWGSAGAVFSAGALICEGLLRHDGPEPEGGHAASHAKVRA